MFRIVVSTDPYPTVHITTLYSSRYVSVKRTGYIFQIFTVKNTVSYVRHSGLRASSNAGCATE